MICSILVVFPSLEENSCRVLRAIWKVSRALVELWSRFDDFDLLLYLIFPSRFWVCRDWDLCLQVWWQVLDADSEDFFSLSLGLWLRMKKLIWRRSPVMTRRLCKTTDGHHSNSWRCSNFADPTPRPGNLSALITSLRKSFQVWRTGDYSNEYNFAWIYQSIPIVTSLVV